MESRSEDPLSIRGGHAMKFEDLLARLSNPARRGLEQTGITDFDKLASLSKKELLSIHGIGPKALPVVNEFLQQLGLKPRD